MSAARRPAPLTATGRPLDRALLGSILTDIWKATGPQGSETTRAFAKELQGDARDIDQFLNFSSIDSSRLPIINPQIIVTRESEVAVMDIMNDPNVFPLCKCILNHRTEIFKLVFTFEKFLPNLFTLHMAVNYFVVNLDSSTLDTLCGRANEVLNASFKMYEDVSEIERLLAKVTQTRQEVTDMLIETGEQLNYAEEPPSADAINALAIIQAAISAAAARNETSQSKVVSLLAALKDHTRKFLRKLMLDDQLLGFSASPSIKATRYYEYALGPDGTEWPQDNTEEPSEKPWEENLEESATGSSTSRNKLNTIPEDEEMEECPDTPKASASMDDRMSIDPPEEEEEAYTGKGKTRSGRAYQ